MSGAGATTSNEAGSATDSVGVWLARSAAAIESVEHSAVEAAGALLLATYRRGGRVFTVGNGGSAANASHLACDLANNAVPPPGRRIDAVSLSDSVPILSAIANDIHYAGVFAEQLRGIGRAGDALVAISVSGESPNVLAAMEYAQRAGLGVIALLGCTGGRAMAKADVPIVVDDTAHGPVEDAHSAVSHALTAYLRAAIAATAAAFDRAVVAGAVQLGAEPA